MSVADLVTAGYLSPLDARFAEAMRRIVGESSAEVELALALASRQTREGHVCVDLASMAGSAIVDAEGRGVASEAWPGLAAWHAALAKSRLVGDADAGTPLVLDSAGRLYLRRYFDHERRVAELLRRRAAPAEEHLDQGLLRDGIDRLLPRTGTGDPDLQRVAAQLAMLQRLLIVSGGPGTGKTSTVVKLLVLLIEQARARGERLDVLLLAPTGKAAARLDQAIERAKPGLACDDAVKALIPDGAATIHRALGPIGGNLTRFRHGVDNPLSAHVVIVDESSMVDVALMRRLLEAVAPAARLILLGDRNQLASVEAGAVLGDICRDASPARWSAELRQRVRSAFGDDLPGTSAVTIAALGDHVVELVRSFRFRSDGGIGALALAINRGDGVAALAVLDAGGDVELHDHAPGADPDGRLASEVVRGFRPTVEARTPAVALAAFDRFRVLCAHRRGPAGVETLNPFVEDALAAEGLLRQSGVWYEHRPVSITRNDYPLRLFNGDVALIRTDLDQGLRAWLAAADGAPRALSPARLPPHETVFAMTIHKSQGSELDDVVVVLPDARSRLLTRELLYTAVTRARRHVLVHGPRAAIAAAIERRVARASGLADALWEPLVPAW